MENDMKANNYNLAILIIVSLTLVLSIINLISFNNIQHVGINIYHEAQERDIRVSQYYHSRFDDSGMIRPLHWKLLNNNYKSIEDNCLKNESIKYYNYTNGDFERFINYLYSKPIGEMK